MVGTGRISWTVRSHAFQDPKATEKECAVDLTVNRNKLEFLNPQWSGVSLSIDVSSKDPLPLDDWERAKFYVGRGERSRL